MANDKTTAIEQLLVRYHVELLQYLRGRLGGSAEQAENIVQETFCRVARYADSGHLM